jgi:hypothetical protein
VNAYPGANFTNCVLVTSSASVGTANPTFTDSSGSQPSPTPVGAIVGGAVGGLVAVVTGVVLVTFLRRRGLKKGSIDLIGQESPTSQIQITQPFLEGIPPRPTQHSDIPMVKRGGSTPGSTQATTSSAPSTREIGKPAYPDAITHLTHETPIPVNTASISNTPERHVDAGVSLGRSGSGRLPPAYPTTPM